MIRNPAVAGQFYPGGAAELRKVVAKLTATAAKPSLAYALIAPHAGYVYSGHLAGAVYSRAIIPASVVLLCPNHTGMGATMGVWHKGAWRTPLGDVLVDEQLASELLDTVPGLEADTAAHIREHSAEVHLPFIQCANPGTKIVVISVSEYDLYALLEAGEHIGRALAGKDALIIASTDMTHFKSAEVAAKLDGPAIEAIRILDPRGLYTYVVGNDVSMCGVLPVTMALQAARTMGAKRADLVGYTHSGHASGDYSSVVAYAGFVLPRESQ
ncbi:MAG: AmmeMemoRadiSam system protein B [Candidatus Brocadiia bacterium]